MFITVFVYYYLFCFLFVLATRLVFSLQIAYWGKIAVLYVKLNEFHRSKDKLLCLMSP